MAFDDIIDWFVESAIKVSRAVAQGIEWLAAKLRSFFTSVANWLETVEARMGTIANSLIKITRTPATPQQAKLTIHTKFGSAYNLTPVAEKIIFLEPSMQEVFDETGLNEQQYTIEQS